MAFFLIKCNSGKSITQPSERKVDRCDCNPHTSLWEIKYITPMEKGFLDSTFASCQAFLTVIQSYHQISEEVIMGTYSGNLESTFKVSMVTS